MGKKKKKELEALKAELNENESFLEGEDVLNEEEAPLEKKAKKPKKEKKAKTPLTKEQKKKRRKKITLGVVAALLVVFILSRLFAPEVLPMVSVAEARTGTVQQRVDGSGSVQSERVETYFSPVSATVADFDLKVGDVVTEGDTLLTYDEAELNELYKQAELTGSAANYGYQDAVTRDNKNVSEYNRSSQDLDTINQQLEDEKNENEHVQDRLTEYSGKQADVQVELSQQQNLSASAGVQMQQSKKDQADAEAALAQAEAAKEQAEKELTDAGPDADAETTAAIQKKIDKAEEDIKTAENAIAAAKSSYSVADASQKAADKKAKELQSSLNSINEKLNGYKDRLTKSGENLEKLQTSKAKEEGIKNSTEGARLTGSARKQLAANNELSTLNASMTKDDISAAKGGIKAEYSGVVTAVSAVKGGPVGKGGSLVTVASSEEVNVEMSITKYDLEKLREGQSAVVTLAGREYTGTVQKLSRLAEKNEKGTPVVKAWISIDNPDDNIYLGLEAKVSVQGQKAQDVLIVPSECVNSGKDGSFCYVVENGMLKKKAVETGLSSDDGVEIKSGLSLGDKVVTSGVEAGMEEGTKVTAVEE